MEAKTATPEKTIRISNKRIEKFKVLEFFIKFKFSDKILKNPGKRQSQKLKGFEQPYSVARFTTPEKSLSFQQQDLKNGISRKLNEFEQSYLEAEFATLGSNLTEPHYRDENFKTCKTFYI